MNLRAPLQVSLMMAGLFSLTSFGCSDDEAPADAGPAREIDYELFPSTHELSAADVAEISTLAPDGALRFERLPEALRGLRVGEVLLAGVSKRTPDGLLRVVLDIQEEEDGAVLLRTGAAPLQMAFRRLHARVADNAAPFARGGKFTGTDVVPLSVSPQFSVSGDLGDRQSYELLAFDGDGNTATKNDQV